MPPQALLLVFSEPGPGVDEAEYHDWYDNEHIPLRVNTSTFLNWTRWEAVDGQTPRFAASYDLESYEATKHAPYTTLVQTRSEREKALLSKIATLDRRHYEALDSPIHPYSSSYDVAQPGPYVSFVSIGVKPELEEEFNRWYDEEHIPMLAKVPGWVRSRRFVLKDTGRLGVEGKDELPPKFIAVHEWQSLDAFQTEEFKAALSTPWKDRLLGLAGEFAQERRVMKLLKSFSRK